MLGFHVPGGDAEGVALELAYQLPAEADPANLTFRDFYKPRSGKQLHRACCFGR